ncbi:WxL domain-containing protein [Enterococcus termitis]|uniref:WxL domain-containing protein n=1 Tax=Enterococcus termitis TaxID=332950 RepID=A0A1E5GIE0_9ENTE|nr:WxL domain-containing protein [Enterococcus termitis]OEG12447.1 hypothetical protein BCR25_07880 [Enterococcus termitis]
MKKRLMLICSFSLALFFLNESPLKVSADDEYSGTGNICFEGKPDRQIVDPEHPEVVADPGESPSTDRALRIDFVPKLIFQRAKISDQDQMYYVNAQLFKDSTGPRGNFIQVSDFREKNTGWLLQVKQNVQFKNEHGKELKGAMLSLDQSWANSMMDQATAPVVSKEVIKLMNIGETYNLAEAKPDKGVGTWSIIFGASVNNSQKRTDTLKPKLDEKGLPVHDPIFNNQPIYENQAVSLFVPGKPSKQPGNYQTVLTWILSELP